MRNVLTLDFESLTVDTFAPLPEPAGPDFLMSRLPNEPSSSPCLNSEQTCGPECIA